jgi:tetratricopeptide (TPR) repeat protein
MRLSIFIFICFSSLLVFSQNTEEKLAAQFFENQEFEKAADLYKKLFKENSSSIYIYENYLNTLLALEEQKTAEKLVEKQIKKHPERLNTLVDLGYVYLKFDEKERAEKYYEKLAKDYVGDRNSVMILAQAMQRRRMPERAVSLYEQAIKKHGALAFYTQLLSGYRQLNEKKKLTDFALEVLNVEETTFDFVIRSLETVYQDEASSRYLQQQTLLKSQQNVRTQVYDELLLEVFIQQKKYSSALRQVIALDKRNKQQGSRVLEMAKLALDNSKYDVSIKAYDYVVGLGNISPNFLLAEEGMINALYFKTTQSLKTDPAEIDSLIAKIQYFVESNGKDYRMASSLYRLAKLQIFYNDNVGAGINILEEIIKTPRLKAGFIADSKLLLGDAYLMVNNIWDAKLMYGQVDKQFKEDARGQEAKFKNAKLSYYTGDFDWAKSQLDILKTATTQLISNNAIELSLLIQDNTGLDSTEDAMKEYAQADFLLYQNKIEKCTEILNLMPFKYPNHALNDEIFFLKARVQEKLGNYEEANKLYTSIYSKFSEDILADNALYRSAVITLQVFDDRLKAQDLFEQLLLDYNSSLYATESRKIYLGLKEGKSAEDFNLEKSL